MLSFALVTAGLIAVLCSIPQFIQLLKEKRSDEFNLFSWVSWIIYQITALMYTISIGAYPYSALNCLWVAYYILMVIFIIKYRIKPGKTKKSRSKKRKFRVN